MTDMTTVEVTVTHTVSFPDREMDVIRLLAQGKTYQGISDALGISVRTAQSYAESSRRKLGVKNARELPAAFREATGIDPLA